MKPTKKTRTSKEEHVERNQPSGLLLKPGEQESREGGKASEQGVPELSAEFH